MSRFLPTFVVDRYEGFDDVRRVPDCTREELERWVEANAAAVRERLPAELVFANHVLLGGPVGAATGAPFAVKAHGSELEYAMRGRPELGAWGAEALAGARATFVGSAHIRDVLGEVCGPVPRVHEVPPGVDIELWRPEERGGALAALLEEAGRDAPNPGNGEERLPDEGNADRLAAFLAGDAPTVVYFGKLIEQKGVHVLLDALRGVDARVVVVGFGPERAALEGRAAASGVAGALHGAARAPPPAAPARPRRRVRRALGLPRGVRDGRGRGRGGRLPAGRLAALGARGGRRRARGGAAARASRPLVSSPTGDADALRERLVALFALARGRPRAPPGDGAASRRGALELGGRRPRLLDLAA